MTARSAWLVGVILGLTFMVAPFGRAQTSSTEPGDEPGSRTGSEEPGSSDAAGPDANPSNGEPAAAVATASGDEPSAQPKAVAAKKPKTGEETQWGIGLNVHGIFLPTWFMNMFFDASTPLNSVAFGAEFVRRKGDFDIIGSIDFAFYSPNDGNYLGKGEDPAVSTDYVHFDNLNALSFAVHFIKHEEILPWMSFVWGGGVGLSIMLGDAYRASNSGCTADNVSDVQQCHPIGMDPDNPSEWLNDPDNQGTKDEDSPDNPKLYREDGIPPVVPLVHLLVGMNFRIGEQFSVRVDGGFRNAFYVGATGHYFF